MFLAHYVIAHERKKSTSRFIISTSDATLGWLRLLRKRRKRRLFTMFPLKQEKLSRADVHGWVRFRDVSLIGLMTQNPPEWNANFLYEKTTEIEMFETGNRDACQEARKPPLVNALTALIINGFFIRSRRSFTRSICHVTSIDPRKKIQDGKSFF